MKIIYFDQQEGEEWLEWRRGGIGASEISILMGSNPYATPLQLWERKCGYGSETPMNNAIKHGIQTEPIARQWLNEQLNLFLQPTCVESSDHPFMRASLDGFDFQHKTLIEIKCPMSHSTIDAARMNGSVPAHWLDQIQWQMMLSEPKRAVLAIWDYRKGGCITVEVHPSRDRIQEMREKAKEFWGCVTSGVAPMSEQSDYIEVQDDDLFKLLTEYDEGRRRKKDLTRDLKALKDTISDFGDDGNFSCKGFKITRINNLPSYNINQMKLDGVDVEKYKSSPGIGYYKISSPKK